MNLAFSRAAYEINKSLINQLLVVTQSTFFETVAELQSYYHEVIFDLVFIAPSEMGFVSAIKAQLIPSAIVLCCDERVNVKDFSKIDLEQIDEILKLTKLDLEVFQELLRLIVKNHQMQGQLLRLKKAKANRDLKLTFRYRAMIRLARLKFKQENLDLIFEKIGRIVLESLGVTRFSIWLMDGQLEQLECQCVITPEDYEYKPKKEILKWRHHNEYFEQLSKGRHVCIDDLEAESKFNHIYEMESEVCRAVIEAPLFDSGVIYGTVRFEDMSQIRNWVIDDACLVDAVSDMVTIAIDQWQFNRLELDHQRREVEFRKQLEQSNEELQEFSAIVSHDLQEPLYKVEAFGELLEEHSKTIRDENVSFYIDRIRNAAKRMRCLIQDILAFSRVQSQGKSFEPVDLNQVCKNVLNDLEVRIQQTQAKIFVDNLPVVLADVTQIEQLFRNILSNALKFSKPEVAPEIKVAFHQDMDKKTQTLYFEDNGIGIEPEDESKIFGVFQRLCHAQEFEGSGIGLAIVQRIVERHGWSVSASGALGCGTTFKIEMPIKNTVLT